MESEGKRDGMIKEAEGEAQVRRSALRTAANALLLCSRNL
jgi:hypothetical protein